MEVHGELKGAMLERLDAIPDPVLQAGHKFYLTTDGKEYKSNGTVYIALKDEATDDPATNYTIEDIEVARTAIFDNEHILTWGEYSVLLELDGASGGTSESLTASLIPIRQYSSGGGGGGGGAQAKIKISVPFGETRTLAVSDIVSSLSFTVKLYEGSGTSGTLLYTGTGFLATNGSDASALTDSLDTWRVSYGAGGVGAFFGLTSDNLTFIDSGVQVMGVSAGANGGDGGLYYYSETNLNIVIKGNTQFTSSVNPITGAIYRGGNGSNPSSWVGTSIPEDATDGEGSGNFYTVYKLRGVLDV